MTSSETSSGPTSRSPTRADALAALVALAALCGAAATALGGDAERALWIALATFAGLGLVAQRRRIVQTDRQFERLACQSSIMRDVLSSVDTTEIVHVALRRVPELYPCDFVTLTLRRRGERCAQVLLRDGAGDREPLDVESRTLRELRRIFRESNDIEVMDANDPRVRWVSHPEQRTCKRIAALPLRFKRDLMGVLSVPLRETGPDSADLAEVRALADQVALALSNARMLEEIQFLAYVDELTGLPNRVMGMERLADAIGRARRASRKLAVAVIDLDHFKRINDSLGEDVGNELIREVVRRISHVMRSHDTLSVTGPAPELARLGGDEFVAIFEEIDSAQGAATACRRILHALSRPFACEGREVFVGASIGVAMFPEDGEGVDVLLRNAYSAMCNAKDEGRRDFRFYLGSMNEQEAERLALDSRLRRALHENALELYYQPIVDAETHEIRGGEGLCRWHDPELGFVSPERFIPIAEESGLVVPLGAWTLREALWRLAAWNTAGFSNLSVSVNVSPRQFADRGFVDMVHNAVDRAGVDPRKLTLEVTESLLMRRTDEAIEILRTLRSTGIRISIDDFGTGYSSLAYLKHLPADSLKIDQSFVRGLGERSEDAAIVSTVIALGQRLGLRVVAEGVEKADQLEYLREHGCDLVQGYLLSPPVRESEMVQLLERGPLHPG